METGMKRIMGLFGMSEKVMITDIPIDIIRPSRYQPRVKFDEEALYELAESIKENGLIQPITVRQVDNYYEIIAGERRLRACKMAGMSTIPCYIMSPSDNQAAQMALVENVQREDLTAIEEAQAYVQLMRQADITQEEVAKRVGKSQSAVANKIRLLNLADPIQQAVIDKTITERHARALLKLDNAKQLSALDEITKKNLNVRQTERYIENVLNPSKTKSRSQGYTQNIQIGMNSVNRCLRMIKDMGIRVDSETKESDEEVTVIIRFPKG